MTTKTSCVVLVCSVFSCVQFLASGQSVSDYAVQVTATVQANPPGITLSWPGDPIALDFYVYRKLRDDVLWGAGVALPPSATNYVDTDVVVGVAYEYAIYKDTDTYFAEGYILSGILVPLTETRGKIILLVDNSQNVSLASELTRLQQDLVGDGWTVLRHDVARSAIDPANINSGVWLARSNEVAVIKALIKSEYTADPTNLKAVFLLGHLPVPYSGNMAPDGHPDHQGAWPADLLYGDMTAAYSDSSVSNLLSGDSRNWNVPRDGKFDNTYVPGDVRLGVGRVDLANLPAFPQSETELLRQYLNKDHNFRHGLVLVQRRGLIDDNFGVLQPSQEALAVNGWRNFAPFFGPTNIDIGGWLSMPPGQTYLWGYGCGPGTYTSASGVASTSDFVTHDTPIVFTMLFGSYFGDWDSQNNLMRAQLGTATYALTCAWVGRPYWYFHHMGLGETIGFSTRLCENGYYGSTESVGLYEVHPALMGDPSLRMHPVAPPAALVMSTNNSGGVNLSWRPSADPVLGYHVYRAPTALGPFTRLTSNLLSGTNYTDPVVTTNIYMVRAVKLEQSPSGSYYNPSQGIFHSLDGIAGAPAIALYQPTNNAFFIAPTNIQMGAGVFDPANCITNVAIYANGLKIADLPGPSYNFTWSNVQPGRYMLTANAMCSSGWVTNSNVANIRIGGLTPKLSLVPQGNGSYNIIGDGVPGLTYHVQSAADLPTTNWQTLGPVTADASGYLQFNASPGATQQFFRTVFP